MLSKKLIKYLTIGYIIFLVIGFFFVRDIVLTDRIDVDEETKEEKIEEVKPLVVTLQIVNGKTAKDYRVEMNTSNSFEDLLEYLRKNSGLKYEKNFYLNETLVNEVDGVIANDNNKWYLYENGQNITGMFENIDLKSEANYKLVYAAVIHNEEPQ